MSVNKVILVGRLGKDPDVRTMPGGDAVANVSLATTENYKDKSGEKQERTEWHNLVFYRRLAEIVGEHLQKGSQIYVEGRIQTRKYQDKEGKDRFTTEIIVSEMHMLGKPGGNAPAESKPANASQSSASSAAPSEVNRTGGALDPDDIPFFRISNKEALIC